MDNIQSTQDFWKKNYERLAEFYKQNGRWPQKDSTGKEKQLYLWSEKQRAFYRDAKIDMLDFEKVQLLNNIQFQWKETVLDPKVAAEEKAKSVAMPTEGRELQWMNKYNAVKRFKEEHGGMLPKSNLQDKDEMNLYQWIYRNERKIEKGELNIKLKHLFEEIVEYVKEEEEEKDNIQRTPTLDQELFDPYDNGTRYDNNGFFNERPFFNNDRQFNNKGRQFNNDRQYNNNYQRNNDRQFGQNDTPFNNDRQYNNYDNRQRNYDRPYNNNYQRNNDRQFGQNDAPFDNERQYNNYDNRNFRQNNRNFQPRNNDNRNGFYQQYNNDNRGNQRPNYNKNFRQQEEKAFRPWENGENTEPETNNGPKESTYKPFNESLLKLLKE